MLIPHTWYNRKGNRPIWQGYLVKSPYTMKVLFTGTEQECRKKISELQEKGMLPSDVFEG